MRQTKGGRDHLYNYEESLALEEDELHPAQYPVPTKYERYDNSPFLKTNRQVRSDSVIQPSLKAKAKHESKSQVKFKGPKQSRLKHSMREVSESTGKKIFSRKASVKEMVELNSNAYNDHSHYISVPQSFAGVKNINFDQDDTKGRQKTVKNGKSFKKKREARKPLNFRSIDRLNQSKTNTSTVGKKNVQSTKVPKEKYHAKNPVEKAEKLRKRHILFLCRMNPLKYRITAFAQEVAAKKIQKYFKQYLHNKKEQERIEFERKRLQIMCNYSKAVIRKYATQYLLRKRRLRAMLEYHKKYNLSKILLIQRKFRAPKVVTHKINFRKFKQRLYALIQGWKVRRIMSYIKSIPEMKEAIDFIRLRNDILNEDTEDLFSKKIIQQFPEKVDFFNRKFNDLYENTVWIKKPVEEEIQKVKKVVVESKSKSQVRILFL